MNPVARIACTMVLTGLGAISSLQSEAAPAPEVRPAIDGVFDLFRQKPVVVLCDYHGLAQQEDF
jgi:hypothetical protein